MGSTKSLQGSNLGSAKTEAEIYECAADFIPVDGAVFYGFFGRRGGVSEGIFAGLNCGPGSGDDKGAVTQNRAIVAAAADVAADRLMTLYQVHGNDTVCVDDGMFDAVDDAKVALWADDARPKADSMVTDRAGVALGILTADCAPVLFYGEKADGSPVIGAAHAGWGGAIRGVMDSTVAEMEALGAERGAIRACVGPCIAQASYEVTYDFAEPFIEEDEVNERFFMSAQKDGHLMFDLPGYCALKLAKLGLKHVGLMDMDTYANEEKFFSYRRTTHRGEPDYGRQVSVIMIRS